MQNTGPPIGGSSISSVLDGEGSEMTQTSSPHSYSYVFIITVTTS